MSTTEHAANSRYLKQIADMAKQKIEIEKRIRLIGKAIRAWIDLADRFGLIGGLSWNILGLSTTSRARILIAEQP